MADAHNSEADAVASSDQTDRIAVFKVGYTRETCLNTNLIWIVVHWHWNMIYFRFACLPGQRLSGKIN